MKDNISIKEWIENFDAGEYNSRSIGVQTKAGWYDWFCKDESLYNKTQALGKKLKLISKSNKLDINSQYVLFKNNCPIYGSLYDDFRICDIETGDVVYTITPKSGHTSMEGKGEVWGRENDFEKALTIGTWKEIKGWFLKD